MPLIIPCLSLSGPNSSSDLTNPGLFLSSISADLYYLKLMIERTSFDPSCVQFCLVTPVFTSRVKWLLFPSFSSDSASSCQCSWDHYLGLYMGSETVIGGTERHFVMMGSNMSLIVDVLWRDVLIFEQSNGCHSAAKGTFHCTCSGRHFNCRIICATVFANV